MSVKEEIERCVESMLAGSPMTPEQESLLVNAANEADDYRRASGEWDDPKNIAPTWHYVVSQFHRCVTDGRKLSQKDRTMWRKQFAILGAGIDEIRLERVELG